MLSRLENNLHRGGGWRVLGGKWGAQVNLWPARGISLFYKEGRRTWAAGQ